MFCGAGVVVDVEFINFSWETSYGSVCARSNVNSTGALGVKFDSERARLFEGSIEVVFPRVVVNGEGDMTPLIVWRNLVSSDGDIVGAVDAISEEVGFTVYGGKINDKFLA